MAPITWAQSADRHAVPHEDAVHAIVHAVYFVPKFDDNRTGSIAPDLYIGPDRQGQLIEVMLERRSKTVANVFHVMLVRPKILNEAKRRIGK